MNKGYCFKALNILHKTLLMGQIIFVAISIFIVYNKMIVSPAKEMDKLFQIITIVLAAAGYFAGSAFFKKKLIQMEELQSSAKEKFEIYRSASIIKWSLLEGPCIFSIISFVLTANYAFLALAFVLILLFTIESPTKTKVALQLGISELVLEDL